MPHGALWNNQQKRVALLTYAVLAILVLFIASAFFSFREMRYSLFGRQASATILRKTPAPVISKDAFELSYQFIDGMPRIDTYVFESAPSAPLEGPTIDVRYIPANPSPNAVSGPFPCSRSCSSPSSPPLPSSCASS